MSKLEKFAGDDATISYRSVLVRLGESLEKETLASPSDTGELMLHLAEGHRRLGQTEKAIDLFSNSFDLWKRLNTAKGMCWSLWGVGTSLRNASAFDESARWLRSAAALAHTAGEQRCRVWSLAQMAEIDRIQGNRKEALAGHQHVLKEFKALRDSKGVTWSYLGMGQIFRMEREFVHAVRAFQTAQEMSEGRNDPIGVAWALRGQAEIAKETRDLAKAAAFARRAQDKFRLKGYPTGIGYSLKTLADVTLLSGRAGDSLLIAESAMKHFRQAGEVRGVAFGLKTIADIESQLGLVREARTKYLGAHRMLNRVSIIEPSSFSPSQGLVNSN